MKAALVSTLLIVIAAGVAAQKVPDAAMFVGQPKGQPVRADQLEVRTHEIASLLRCPVCQGMSVADSPAEMAVNMKRQVRELLARGYTERQILDYFKRSYGEFVLLKPEFAGVNRFVWLLPLFAVAGGVMLVVVKLRKLEQQPARAAARAPDATDPYLEQVRTLVSDKR